MSKNIIVGLVVVAAVAAAVYVSKSSNSGPVVPLKEAKLNIEHNATDSDTGFQGFVDSEGWGDMTITGPDGDVLSFKGRGSLGSLGLTELFFETVEPENKDVSVADMLAKLPEGQYLFSGTVVEDGEEAGRTEGKAWLTHNIPEGPKLRAPAQGAVISSGLAQSFQWSGVTKSITGAPVTIVAYQIIIQKESGTEQHMVGKPGRLDVYLPPTQTSFTVSSGFLERGASYEWEVLAIEESGNQTLSSGTFSTTP